MGVKKRLIIDVDTGIDDAQAIMMALSVPDVEVVGITCVAGNVNLNYVCQNTLKVLQAWDRLDVPVFPGSARSLLGNNWEATGIHGNDGLGDAQSEHVPDVTSDKAVLQKEHAVTALLRLVNENPGELTLVAVGPLTNIALALCMDPSWGTKLKDAVIMGGNISGRGNVTPSAEFNFYVDPEAASATLKQLKCPLRLLAWEPCLQNNMDWEWFEKLMAVDTPKGRFHRAINERSAKRKKQFLKIEYYSCDPAAMFLALDDNAVKNSVKKFCCVELANSLTRGQMVVDWNGTKNEHPNVEIVTDIDIKLLRKYYENMVQ